MGKGKREQGRRSREGVVVRGGFGEEEKGNQWGVA